MFNGGNGGRILYPPVADPAVGRYSRRERSMYKDMIDTIGYVEQADPELGAAMNRELGRQRQNIELIASENIVSPPSWRPWAAC